MQELAQRRILSAPLILKPNLESIAEEEGSEPAFLGWIDIATIFNAFLQGAEILGHLSSFHLQYLTLLMSHAWFEQHWHTRPR